MFTLSSLVDLYRHMEWADAAVWSKVLSADSSKADARLRESLHHLHLVQHAFLRVWRDEPRDAPYPAFDDTASLMSWARTYYGEIFAQLAKVSDAALNEPLPVPWAEMVEKSIGRKPRDSQLGDTVLQVALHSQYHRGQVNSRLREADVDPPMVDYIAWVWMGRPAPDWP